MLATLLIGAHFLRSGVLVGVLLSLALIPFLFVRQPPVRGVVRILLVLAVIEWVRTAWSIAQARIEVGQPYGRMLVILAVVAAFTAWSAWLLPAATETAADGGTLRR